MDSVGELAGKRYRIVDRLGRGGMGEVYLAVDQQTSAEVALKVTDLSRCGAGQRESVRQQFRREAQTLLKLRHPSLPAFLDFWEEEGQAFLVMERVPGHDLQHHIATSGPLDEATLLHYLQTLATVLHFLHSQEPPVIFRDLKPANIMLCPDGELKLIDFGLAKSAPLSGDSQTHTGARGMVSPGFAAPEQYSGGTDARSDLYSLGATAYFLATAVTPPDAIERISSGAALQAPDRLNPELSSSTALLITRLMQPRREKRPASAQEVLVQLRTRSTADGQTTSVTSPVQRPSRKPWRPLVLGGLLLTSMLVYRFWPQPGVAVLVQTRPPGAAVEVGGKVLGTTPCNLTLQPTSQVRLLLPGHFPNLDQPARFARGSAALTVLLRPGQAPADVSEEELPGFYPAGLGSPPSWLQPTKDRKLGNQAVGVPKGWKILISEAERLEVQYGDGLSGPRRRASLDILPPQGSLAEVLQREVLAQGGHWLWVRSLSQDAQVCAYFESPQGGASGRRAWLASDRSGQRFRLQLEVIPCENVYDFLRDLDTLKAAWALD